MNFCTIFSFFEFYLYVAFSQVYSSIVVVISKYLCYFTNKTNILDVMLDIWLCITRIQRVFIVLLY